MAAAIAATTPSPVGVENCCNAWEVWDRRVWVGSRAPIFSIIARAAAGDTDLRRIVEPYLRRNRICAASQASRSEEHTSELQSLMRISYAVFCLKKKNKQKHQRLINTQKQVRT